MIEASLRSIMGDGKKRLTDISRSCGFWNVREHVLSDIPAN